MSTKGTAAGYCLLAVLVYETRVYNNSLRKGTGEAFPFQDTFCSRSRPQGLTLHTDVVHPEEIAGRCHLPSFGVMGEKQRLCESQEPHHAPCSHTFSVVVFTPAMYGCVQGELKTCMSGQLVAGAVGFLGMINDSWGLEAETGGSTGKLDCHQAVLHHSTPPACPHARPGYHGRAAGKQDGM